MSDLKFIGEGWELYEKATIPDNTCLLRVAGIKMDFYSGAIVFNQILLNAEREGASTVQEVIASLRKELEDFRNELKDFVNNEEE